MKSTRSWTKLLLAFLLVALLGVGIFGLGGCKSQDGTNEPTIGDTEFPFDANEAQRCQEETAETLDIPVEYENEIGMKLRLIPAGEFMMGSPEDEEDRDANESLHQVEITKPFYMGVCEVTQGEWEVVMGTTPWEGEKYAIEGADYPATYVSWEDAQEFCRRLSAQEGKSYRLPTEAEWEYSCRAGSATAYCFGDSSSKLGEYAWIRENASDIGQRHPSEVGLKKANAWGLHDMHGNVWELCQDWYYREYYRSSPTQDPTGASESDYRVRRGGSWYVDLRHCRSAFRFGFSPGSRVDDKGFRVACSVE
jgi:formylglycine-generating enzyme required for sulfatase activity